MMNRHYSREEFIEKVNKIKEIKPNISITTDIIVGFPEETDEDFLDTINLCKEVKFSKIHAFPFSLRKGTKAENLKQVNDKVKNDRMNTLLELDKELEEEYKLKFVGEEFDVIIETYHELYQVGHTSNYLEVNILYNENLVGNMVKIKITKYENNKLYGELIN